jgi:hypothetical protein
VIRFAPILLLGLGSCAGVPPAQAPLIGEWGGAHVHLALTAAGGAVEYDCAHGTIDTPVMLDSAGRFAAAGTHVREHGGPVRMGEVLPSSPARYSGAVRGDRMTLRVDVSGIGPIGPYELVRGAPPQLFRCL